MDPEDSAGFEGETVDQPASGSQESAIRQIGDYQIRQTIGRGGMGTVYAAYQESMHRNVALKILQDVFDHGASRFEREAWIAGRLSHPNIVKVHAYGVEGNARYIAMELIEGPSLHEEIREAKKRQADGTAADSGWLTKRVRTTVELFVGAADALDYVHQQGILHRDIKPSNLLLDRARLRLLLTDFGLAREEDGANLTRRGDFLGTVRYMSPEQLLAQRAKVDRRSDIWSLGVSLYEALTLNLPYAAETDEGYISAIAMRQPIPARHRSRAVPRDLETVLMKCMEREPERRYATAGELRADLVRYLEERPVLGRRAGVLLTAARMLQRHRVTGGGIALTAILAAVLFVALFRQQRERSDLERIRWTLEQIIRTDGPPKALPVDWPALEGKLQREVRAHPTGAIALLAQRADVRIHLDVPSFALASDPPDFDILRDEVNLPGVNPTCTIRIEGSWDQGPWKLIGVSYTAPGAAGSAGGSLERLLGKKNLPAMPHVFQARAVFRFLDWWALPDNLKSSLSKFSSFPLPDQLQPAESQYTLLTETRVLGRWSISVFQDIPANFPQQVADDDSVEPVKKWFDVSKVRVLRVKVPAGGGGCVVFSWPGEEDRHFRPNQKDSPVPEDLAGGIELWGHRDSGSALPLAARASVWIARQPRPLFLFDLALGRNLQSYRPNSYFQSWGDDSKGPSERPFLRLGLVSSAAGSLPKGLEDGVSQGHMDLQPSREVALRTHRFDRYYGKSVSLPVAVEIVSVAGRWEGRGCESITPGPN